MAREIPESKNIVVIGGGTGTYTVLLALKKFNFNLSAVVSMCDDGGSTGRLRDEYGVLPPGDIRRSLIALSAADSQLRGLFNFRFKGGPFKAHNFGNIFLAALEKKTGDFNGAIGLASKVLSVRGEVYPVTLDNVRLRAELENGNIVSGETNIDIPKHNPDIPIKRIFTVPRAKGNPEAIKAILSADAVIVGPGDLYTSVLPNFLASGVAESLKNTKAKKIFICNLMTKNGETNGYSVKNFVDVAEKYIGKKALDFILANKKIPTSWILKKYAGENAHPVEMPPGYDDKRIIFADVLSTGGSIIRHDVDKLGSEIIKLL